MGMNKGRGGRKEGMRSGEAFGFREARRQTMRDYHINIFRREEDGGYIADIPDLEACSAFGHTPEEALQQVEVAKTAWLQAAKAEGKAHSRTPVQARNLPKRPVTA